MQWLYLRRFAATVLPPAETAIFLSSRGVIDRSLGQATWRPIPPSADLIPEGSEISQLIDTVNVAMPSAQLNHDDVLHAFAGYYPLQSDSIKSGIYQGTGEYRLVDHERIDGLGGLITGTRREVHDGPSPRRDDRRDGAAKTWGA